VTKIYFPELRVAGKNEIEQTHEHTSVHKPRSSCDGNQFERMRNPEFDIVEYSNLKSIEDGCQVDSIYTDFSKAFDKMCHCLLLDKMSTDVEPSRCQWLGSYFSGRIQRVKKGDCVSRDILVTSGVLQGGHLGPLCFIWFVNEITWIFRHVRVLFLC
jgi:hypothetical protein